ncbi:MAG: glycine cleavage system protein GcvH [Eubacteriales bacterium]
MEIPSDLFFAKSHEWVKFTAEGTAKIGLSDHAQDALGDVAFINLCDEGDSLSAGEILGDIESIKAVSDVYSPIGGTVVSVNEELLDYPERINADPYGSWLVELDDVVKSNELLDAAAYEKFLAEEE